MSLFMLILCFIVFVALIVVSGFSPRRSPMSSYELTRRKGKGDEEATAALERSSLLVDVLSLQRVMSALLLVVLVVLLVATFGWLFGVIIAVFVALEYGAIARLSIFQSRSQKLYEKYEPYILRFIGSQGRFLAKVLRNVTPSSTDDRKIDSREELQYLVAESGVLLSKDEKDLIRHGLEFENKTVRDIMTPRGVIDSLKKDELLGPLVLDDLHKTGHSRFPVIDGDIDHVVGMIYIHNIFSLDAKKSVTAESSMEARVFYIREDQLLSHALMAFLRTHHHLFIVVNEYRETVGLLSLEDVIETLLGRKIVDEFDTHEDLRLVAKRNPRGNNHPQKKEDV